MLFWVKSNVNPKDFFDFDHTCWKDSPRLLIFYGVSGALNIMISKSGNLDIPEKNKKRFYTEVINLNTRKLIYSRVFLLVIWGVIKAKQCLWRNCKLGSGTENHHFELQKYKILQFLQKTSWKLTSFEFYRH